MAKLKMKKVDKFVKDLEIGDEIKLGGLHVVVTEIEKINRGKRVILGMKIIGATKLNEHVVLYINTALPVTTLQ